MKVSEFKSIALSVPLDRPFRGSGQIQRGNINVVLVQLATGDGLEAFGITFTWNERQVKSLKACIDDLRDVIIGQNIFCGAEAWQKLYDATGHMGHSGYGIYAVSAIDSALWVLRAKAFGKPLACLLGGFRDRVPAYASHLLWRDWSIDDLQRDAEALVKQGFKFMKMRMGDKPFKVEIERLKAVREVVGTDIGIMVDANWAWSVSQAVTIGRQLEEYDVYWLEDPLASDDPDQLGQVADALDLAIADGETFCTKYDFRRLIETGAGDIFLVDLQRVGGVTEWMKVAAMAEAWNLPVTSHLFHDFSMHLVSAVPNGLMVEYMPWYDKIYQEPPQVKNGFMEISDKPGLGLELNLEAIKKYQLR